MSGTGRSSNRNTWRRETPYGVRYVAAAFGDEIHVATEDPRHLPCPLSMRPDERPHSRTVVFTVVFEGDGTRGVELRGNPRRRRPVMDGALHCARALAESYAVECAEYMDGLRASQRAERVAELESTLARIPEWEDRTDARRWTEITEERLSRLPEPWQGLLRRTEPTGEAMSVAPAPLGPLLVRGEPKDDVERAVLDTAFKMRMLEWQKREHEKDRGQYTEELAGLLGQAERDAELSARGAPSPP